MRKKHNFNLTHLFLIISLGFITLAIIMPGKPGLHLRFAGALSLFYISFSAMHHYNDKTFTVEIILDYILIAALVLVILATNF